VHQNLRVQTKNHAKPDRPATATSPDKVLNVLLSFVKDSHNSIRDVAQQHIGLASVHKTFKKEIPFI